MNFASLASVTSKQILYELINMKPTELKKLPHTGGIYLLYDHSGTARYIGMTTKEKGFYDRIYKRHRSGSEHVSHQFSACYNIGRMWRDRDIQPITQDAKIAKALRNDFIEHYCKAAYVELDLPKFELAKLEADIIKIAPSETIFWNNNRSNVFCRTEPRELVDRLIEKLRYSKLQIDAVGRQNDGYTTTQTTH